LDYEGEAFVVGGEGLALPDRGHRTPLGSDHCLPVLNSKADGKQDQTLDSDD